MQNPPFPYGDVSELIAKSTNVKQTKEIKRPWRR
nr:MAG TPA: hypothetical protein [Caudoviricetes sp.]